MIAAHVAGVPVEEFLPGLAGAGGSLLAVRVWIAVHFRDRKDDEEVNR